MSEPPDQQSKTNPDKQRKRRTSGRSKHAQQNRATQIRHRHHARELAIQVLFEVDVTHHSSAEVLARTRATQSPDEAAFDYLALLVRGVERDQERIDEYLGAAAPAFPVAQLATVDRNILRIAIFELLHQSDVPPKAAINEAIDFAKAYGGESSGKFVNGVLGTVYRRITAERAESAAPVP
jgi:transcription antitermination protein NusB